MHRRYKAFDPDSKVIGQAIIAFSECTKADKIEPLLIKHGFTNIDPNAWYSVQTWLDILNDLTTPSNDNPMFDFISVGMKVGEIIRLPPEYDELAFVDALIKSGGRGYYMCHQGNVGKHSISQVSDQHIQVHINCPYPDDFMFGVYYAFAHRFKSPDKNITIAYDLSQPRRDDGGKITIINIMW